MIILPSVRKGLLGKRGPAQFNAPGLPVWSAAVRAAIAGTGDAKALFIGDSETAGEGAGESASAHNNGRNHSIVAQLCDVYSGSLASLIERRAVWGTGNYTAPEMAIYIPEMTVGAGWSSSGSGGFGAARLLNNTTSNPASFTHPGGCDTCDVYFVVQSSNGLVSIDIDGGTPVTSNLNGSNAVRKLTVTGSGLGAHTLNIIRTSGGFVQYIGHRWRNSTAKRIYIDNAGGGSMKAADWIANAAPWQAYPMVASEAYQLYIIQLGVNDWPSTSQATYEANMQTLITQCKLSGDVLLVGSAQRSVNAAEQAAFFTSLQNLATANGLPAPINFKDVLGTYAAATAAGFMYDVTHPNAVGYGLEAQALQQSIFTVPAAWVATKSALNSFLGANVGASNPHSLGNMSNPPTVRLSVGDNSAPDAPDAGLTALYTYLVNDASFRYNGGGNLQFDVPITRRFPTVTRGDGGGNVNGGLDAVDWRTGFTTNAAKVAFRLDGSGTFFDHWRFIINGQYMSVAEPTPVSPGRRWLVLDFGSVAQRDIIIEGYTASFFYNVGIAPGDTIAPLPASAYRAIMLGDSLTAAVGADVTGNGLGRVLFDYLGIPDGWLSGLGGTGYVNDASATLNKLSARINADLDRSLALGSIHLICLAAGINDFALSGIQAQVNLCLNLIRQRCPAALIAVIGPWDANAPSAPDVNLAACKSAIQSAVATINGAQFFDPQGIAYTKNGSPHPDTAGHLTLGQWANTQIRNWIAS